MGFDTAVQSYVASILTPTLRYFGRFAAGLELGDQLASFCLLFIMAGYVAQKPRLVKTFVGALVSLAAGGIVVQLLKYLIGRARPAMGVGDMTFIGPHFTPSGFDSFPSGHTTAMFSLLAFVCRFYPSWTIPLYIAGLALSLLARVVTGQHFLTDVIGGAVLGTLIGIVTAAYFRGRIERPQPATEPPPPQLEVLDGAPPRRLSGAVDIALVAIFSGLVLLVGSGLDVNAAVLGVLTALAGYFLARQLTGRDTALYAALVLASAFLFVNVSRTLPADTAWLFFTTLAFTYYAHAVAHGRRSLFFLVLAYASIGLGILAKGWPALLPVPIFCLYEYLRDKPSAGAFARTTLERHGILLAVLIVAVFRWLYSGLFAYSQPGDFFLDEVVARTGLTRNAGRVLYYLPLTLLAVFPWTFFAVACLAREGKRWSRDPSLSPETLLLMLWAVVVVGVFPFVAARAPHTLVLALPPLSCFVARYLRRDFALSPAAVRFSLLATLLTTGALIVAGIVFYFLRPQYGTLKIAAPFAVLMAFLVSAWLLRHKEPPGGWFTPVALGALAFYLSAIAIALAG
jgi:membrane-associated phospholipid phosphatase